MKRKEGTLPEQAIKFFERLGAANGKGNFSRGLQIAWEMLDKEAKGQQQ